MDGIYSFSMNPLPETSSEDDFFSSPQFPASANEYRGTLFGDLLGLQQFTDDFKYSFGSQDTVCSDDAFTEMGRSKSAQGDDVLPQFAVEEHTVPIYSNRLKSFAQTPLSSRVFSTRSTAPQINLDAELELAPARLTASSPSANTAAASPFHFHSSPRAGSDGFSGDILGSYPLRAFFSTPLPSSSRKVRMSSDSSTPTLEPHSSQSTSASMPTSPLANVANLYRSPFIEGMYGDLYGATLVPNSSDVSPVIHRSPCTSTAAPFRLRPADFSNPVHTDYDEAPLFDEDEKTSAPGVSNTETLFSPFVLQTPEKSLTSEAPAAARLSTSPLTPVTDDECCIADPPFMKDNMPQNPPSSLAIHFGQKRAFNHVDSPSPSCPPKRARANYLLALKEKAKLANNEDPSSSSTSHDSASSPERPLAETNVNQRPTSSYMTRSATAMNQPINPPPPPPPAAAPAPAPSTTGSEPSPTFSQRTFPLRSSGSSGTTVDEISDMFSLFYRRFPASSYFKVPNDSSECALFEKAHPGGNYNPPRNAFDLYTPRFVKGKGKDKMGLCPICIEEAERGGEGKKVWLAMKFSAYKCYHMQYSHGISASSSVPFSPPLAFRTTTRASVHKSEKTIMKEGKCHKCMKWVPVEGIKDVEVKVKELFWWKHAAACHSSTTIEGERDIFEQDEVYETLLALGSAAEEIRKR